jgi:hypothetical protein
MKNQRLSDVTKNLTLKLMSTRRTTNLKLMKILILVLSAAVLRGIIDSGIGKIAAQDSQASVSSSLMVEGDESFDWNTV